MAIALRATFAAAGLALLLAASAAVAPSSAHADGQLSAVQIEGACSDVTITARGLTPETSVRLLMQQSGQHGHSEVPSSARVTNSGGGATWMIPALSLPGSACRGDQQLTFSVVLISKDGKVGARVAGPVDIQRSPSPGIVGHGGVEPPSDGTPPAWVLVVIVLGVIGGAVAARTLAVRRREGRLRPRSR